MLVFFFPFFENLGTYVYDSMRARTVLFLKGISATIFCTACARVLSLCMRLPARARGRRRRRLLLSRSTRRQRRKVDKCRVADKKKTDRQTNKPTNKHTLLFYRYRFSEASIFSHLFELITLESRQARSQGGGGFGGSIERAVTSQKRLRRCPMPDHPPCQIIPPSASTECFCTRES